MKTVSLYACCLVKLYAGLLVMLSGCGGGTASDPPVSTASPEVVGACCTTISCTATTYDLCVRDQGGVWANQPMCDAAECRALLGQVTIDYGGGGGEGEDEDEDEVIVTCCIAVEQVCVETDAFDCQEIDGTAHEGVGCAEACPDFPEEVFEDLVTCCLPAENLCTYLDETECEDRGGAPEFDRDCVEICPELPEVDV